MGSQQCQGQAFEVDRNDRDVEGIRQFHRMFRQLYQRGRGTWSVTGMRVLLMERFNTDCR